MSEELFAHNMTHRTAELTAYSEQAVGMEAQLGLQSSANLSAHAEVVFRHHFKNHPAQTCLQTPSEGLQILCQILLYPFIPTKTGTTTFMSEI
jgi:hypothetical protein